MKDYTESSGSYKFLHKDYLGSILAITDEAGNIKEQRHFDAWGNLTHFKANGVDKNVNEFNDLSLISRGYTGHEHFLEVGIIHMNGRLYDPLLRRFLNADENIQDPHNTQNYNKYGYVINNPLLYADVSGEDFGISLIIAAAVAATTSIATDYYLNRPIDIGNLFESVAIAVLSAGIANGIGDIFKAGGEIAKALKGWTWAARAGAHAITQGALSYVQGGNFLSGALAGAFASVSNDLLGHYIDKAGSNSFIRTKGFALITGAASGGVGSVLGGGNFWMGAGQGLIVTAFNFLAHRGDEPRPKKKSTAKNSTISNKLKKYYNKISEFLETHGTSEASLSVKRGLFFDLGIKNFGQVNLGTYIEDTYTSSASNSNIINTKTSKFSAGIMAEGGVNYSYDIQNSTHQLTIGGYTFALEFSKTGVFIGWNPGASLGIGMGGELNYKLGLNFTYSEVNNWFNNK